MTQIIKTNSKNSDLKKSLNKEIQNLKLFKTLFNSFSDIV